MKEKIEKLKKYGYFEIDMDYLEKYIEERKIKRKYTSSETERYANFMKKRFLELKPILARLFDDEDVLIFYTLDYIRNNSIEKLKSIPSWLDDTNQDA